MKVVTSAKIRRDIREQLIKSYSELDFQFHTNIDEAEVDLFDADVLITYGEDLNDEHIYQAKKLKWIMVISAGLDEMPFEAINKQGITVTNAKGIHAIPMAEYTIGMMLQVSRQAKVVIENEYNKKWDRSPTMTELSGKTIGILGAGSIGQEIARLSKAFNMKVIGLNRSGSQVKNFDEIVTKNQLESLLKESDFLVSVLPKIKETNNILGEDEFFQMKKNAILINIGRGNVINEQDLIKALQKEEIQHAVLDVFNEEPLPKENSFWLNEKITVTPHLSGISPQYQPRAFEIFDHNMKVFLGDAEKYINLIDPEKGY
ncbi:D-2-hydroxyacid dehydrogenase [Salipaludibacillus sp. HK11]|uniref:D-2-hydroxyacid dehydrogenase n=1 Tax=Salipaludibacillus sp. HK11 TaxID=3394320 RepID=UPI0039FBE089